MMKYFETETFQWMAIPTVETDGKIEDIVSWVKSQRDNNNFMIKAVLPNADSADCEGIINWTSKLYKDETSDNGDNTVTITRKTYTAEQGTPRIAGILAGTDVTISATYAPLKISMMWNVWILRREIQRLELENFWDSGTGKR